MVSRGISWRAGPPPEITDRVAWWAEFASNQSAHAVLQAGVEAMQTEGQGVWRYALHLPNALPASATLAGLVATFVKQIADRKCCTCQTNFSRQHPPAAIGTLCADVPDPQNWMVSGVCAPCFRRPDIREVIRDAYETGLGVKLRMIEIGSAGRA